MVDIQFDIPDSYNASEVLFHNLEAGRGEKVAVYCGEQTITYARLGEDANRAGNALKSLGLEPGSRVMQLMLDTPAFPALFFGAVKAGYVPVVTNTTLPPDDYRYFLQDAGAKAVVVDAPLYPEIEEIRADCPELAHVVVVGGEEVPGTFSWEDLCRAASPELHPIATHKDDPAFWMYSSGSTGRPKGIVHLQHDIPYTVASYARHVLDIRESDRTFSVPKLFFAYGFGNNMTFPFSVGASAILYPGRPTPEAAFEQIERYRPSLFFAVPTIYVPMAALPGSEERDLSSIRLCISAAEPLPVDLYETWLERYGLEIIEGLGSTEMLHIYISNYPGRVKPGASGTYVPGYELKLEDSEGRPVAEGEHGNLLARGDSSAPHYWNRPNKTQHTMRGDWIFTGDRFYQDEDGYFHFSGRTDEMLKVSGQWVSPIEVEITLGRHPAVFENAVIGVQNEAGLVRTKAFVVLNEDYQASATLIEELQQFVKSQIAPYKYPRIIQFVDALPKTGTNKINRQKLKSL